MIVDKLKKIVTTLGGSYTAKDDTVSELLEKINTAFENGGGGGGGGSALPVYVPFTLNIDGGTDTISVTTTAIFSDVKAAVVAKKNVIAEVALDDSAFYVPLAVKKPASDPTGLVFGGIFDFAGSGEAAEPAHIRIYFSEAGSSIVFDDLTVTQ